MAQISIRIDDNVKEQTDLILSELGLNMSTAFNMFARQIVRQGGIPFPVQLGKVDIAETSSREQIVARGKTALSELRYEASQSGQLSDEDIEAEIRAYRKEKRNK
ncbi:MAG: type II toxin-antitoxin system RelB/DinJ family antitoxin [Clostridiales Family XIII bacterium]|jgi:addiction module RelB/DinJ family antitoxin|nr:type II toxin-antitoxin system RelB/DinJ family antitoxin [Clostridiales Family XIII bacterium]